MMTNNHLSFRSKDSRFNIVIRKVAIAALTLLLIAGSAHRPGYGEANNGAFELQAITPEFWTLFDRKAQLTKLASGFGFTEGPVWDSSGYLWVSDETLNKIFKVNTSTGQKQEIISLGDPDGNTYDSQHRLLDCASVLRAIIRLSPDGWKIRMGSRFLQTAPSFMLMIPPSEISTYTTFTRTVD
jgi:hypothetical protein